MLHCVVALAAEARPLNEHFKLRSRETHGGFRLFESDDMRLIVSGPGKVAAAAAVAYLTGLERPRQPVAWLNVGIAGQRDAALGHVMMAHQIVDRSGADRFYPVFVFRPPVETAELVTVERPETDYPDAGFYDMEASAYFQTATRFSTAELVHVLKVVSDNRASPAEEVSPERVDGLIRSSLDSITEVVAALQGLAREVGEMEREPAGFRELSEAWRFTVTQKRRLRHLLTCRQALVPDDAAGVPDRERFATARDCLDALEREISALPRSVRGERR